MQDEERIGQEENGLTGMEENVTELKDLPKVEGKEGWEVDVGAEGIEGEGADLEEEGLPEEVDEVEKQFRSGVNWFYLISGLSVVNSVLAVAGSEWGFVQKMNDKAWRLGLRNTKYINASGLPGKGQYSTAYDQARLMKEAMKYSFIRTATAKKTYTIRRPNGKKIRLRNHNKLLWRYSKHVVGKTGFTRAAGRCYFGYAKF